MDCTIVQLITVLYCTTLTVLQPTVPYIRVYSVHCNIDDSVNIFFYSILCILPGMSTPPGQLTYVFIVLNVDFAEEILVDFLLNMVFSLIYINLRNLGLSIDNLTPV
jgi:hypothetical protein